MGKERRGRKGSRGDMGSARGGASRAADGSKIVPQPAALPTVVWPRKSKEGKCGICGEREIEK